MNEQRISNRRIGYLVLGAMILMAGIGLAWALATVGIRREHDKVMPTNLKGP